MCTEASCPCSSTCMTVTQVWLRWAFLSSLNVLHLEPSQSPFLPAAAELAARVKGDRDIPYTCPTTSSIAQQQCWP